MPAPPGTHRYEHGQQYAAHWDVNDSPERLELMRKRGVLGGMRTATLLMYLSGEQRTPVRCSTMQYRFSAVRILQRVLAACQLL